MKSLASAEESEEDMATENPRAIRGWRRVMMSVVQFMMEFCVQRANDFRQSLRGCPSRMASKWIALWMLGNACLGAEGAIFSKLSHAYTVKQQTLKEDMSHGVPLPPRNSQLAPRVESSMRSHPATSLAAAGNQYQREVWCQECRSRWKVSTLPMLKSPSAASSISDRSGVIGTPASSTTAERVVRRCNLPAETFKVRKAGKNRGKRFYRCSRDAGVDCDFSQWDPTDMAELAKSKGAAPKAAMKREPEVSPEVNRMMEEVKEAQKELLRKEGSLRSKQDELGKRLRRWCSNLCAMEPSQWRPL